MRMPLKQLVIFASLLCICVHNITQVLQVLRYECINYIRNIFLTLSVTKFELFKCNLQTLICNRGCTHIVCVCRRYSWVFGR